MVGVTINSCSRLPHRFLYECQSRQACCLALRSGEMTSVEPSESEVGVSHNWGPILCQKKGLCLRIAAVLSDRQLNDVQYGSLTPIHIKIRECNETKNNLSTHCLLLGLGIFKE